MDLVVGSTGFVGGLAVRQLCAQGRAVRALVRGGTGHAAANALADLGAAIVDGDLTDPASIARACRVRPRWMAASNSATSISSKRRGSWLGSSWAMIHSLPSRAALPASSWR